MEVNGQHHAPAALPLYTLNRRLGWPQNRYERLRPQKNVLPLPGFEPQDVQLIENRILKYLGRKITHRAPFASKLAVRFDSLSELSNSNILQGILYRMTL
jgi:hypothetical protein